VGAGREPMRRPVVVAVVLLSLVMIVSAAGILSRDRRDGSRTTATSVTSPGTEAAPAEGDAGERGSSEADREQQEPAEPLAGRAEARVAGTFGPAVGASSTSLSGWPAAQLLNPATDDWEPPVAADPNAPYVYLLPTGYGHPKPCPSHCPTPY